MFTLYIDVTNTYLPIYIYICFKREYLVFSGVRFAINKRLVLARASDHHRRWAHRKLQSKLPLSECRNLLAVGSVDVDVGWSIWAFLRKAALVFSQFSRQYLVMFIVKYNYNLRVSPYVWYWCTFWCVWGRFSRIYCRGTCNVKTPKDCVVWKCIIVL